MNLSWQLIGKRELGKKPTQTPFLGDSYGCMPGIGGIRYKPGQELVENGIYFRQEELFASICAQNDDAGNDSGKVGQNDRHERTSE
jgi:hypothetical protein